jgi:hypothetical protein
MQVGLAVAVVVCLVCLLVPLFRPLDLRTKDVSLLNADEVILYTDPPGATISVESLNSRGHALGSTGKDPIPVLDLTKDPSRPGQEKDVVFLFLDKPGYAPIRQTIRPMELKGKMWPQQHQPPLRLTPENPWVYLIDYLLRYRRWLFVGFCMAASGAIGLSLALVSRYRWLSKRDRLRQDEKSRDNLAGISVLGYEIVERIGSGATSLVYRGVSERDFLTERAVRFSRLADITSKEIDSFRREVGVYQKIDHPNIVKAFDFQRFENTFVIVMELIEGRSMDTLFGDDRPLSIDTLLPLFTRIADGLDHAHAQGIVHRDLKPANVMIRNDGSPAVVDFGMATDLNVTKITQTGIIKGTLAYIAPEQITSPKGVGPPADQFAFGMMLYEALSGKLAYNADDPSRLLTERLSGQAIPFSQAAPQFSEQVASAVMTMIAADPQERFATISEGMALVSQALQKECNFR